MNELISAVEMLNQNLDMLIEENNAMKEAVAEAQRTMREQQNIIDHLVNQLLRHCLFPHSFF